MIRVVLAVAWMVSACASGGAADDGQVMCMVPESQTGTMFPPSMPLESRFTTCTVDSDCVFVELGCCDVCNGGLAVAANAERACELQQDFSEGCREGFGCNAVGCRPPPVLCMDGACVLGQP